MRVCQQAARAVARGPTVILQDYVKLLLSAAVAQAAAMVPTAVAAAAVASMTVTDVMTVTTMQPPAAVQLPALWLMRAHKVGVV